MCSRQLRTAADGHASSNSESAWLQILYNKDVVSAVLTFMRHLDQLKRQPILMPGGSASPKGTELENDPSQPSNLFERTMHAFAQQNIPISQPLSLPVLSVSLTCPGALSSRPRTRSNEAAICGILAFEAAMAGSRSWKATAPSCSRRPQGGNDWPPSHMTLLRSACKACHSGLHKKGSLCQKIPQPPV